MPPALLLAIGCIVAAPSWAVTESSNVLAGIELRSNVEVERPAVRLGDIARIDADPQVAKRLVGLPLGQVPREGESLTLDRATLADWIRQRAGLDATRIVWSGAMRSQVHLATTEVSGQTIAEAARDLLRDALRKSGLRAEVSIVQTPPDVNAPRGRLELKPRSLALAPASATSGPAPDAATRTAALLAKRQSVWVDLWVDGGFVRTVAVSLEVSAFGPALVAARDLAAGQTLDARTANGTQVAVREIDWAGRSALPLAAIEATSASNPTPSSEPYRLRHAVVAGQALTHVDVERAPLVLRGDYATLRTVQGAIELESRVEVLQDGTAGQSVHVKRTGDAAIVAARVVGPGQVEMKQ